MSISQQIADLKDELQMAHIMAGNLLSCTASDKLSEPVIDAAAELINIIRAEITELEETKP